MSVLPRSLLGALLCALATPGYPDAVEIDAASFGCIQELTPVKHFFVGNLRGQLDATLEVAGSAEGGVYPEGSVVQLVPTEVMVKREAGYSAVTKDWEFFELSVSPEGTEITTRGTTNVVNRFGGNCFACHARARPEWDMICGKTNGCEPIPLTPAMISGIQKTDPRCEPSKLTEAEAAALKLLAGTSQ
jgi:hypothetical protein